MVEEYRYRGVVSVSVSVLPTYLGSPWKIFDIAGIQALGAVDDGC